MQRNLYLVLLLTVLFPAFAQAQNWHLMRMSTRYGYVFKPSAALADNFYLLRISQTEIGPHGDSVFHFNPTVKMLYPDRVPPGCAPIAPAHFLSQGNVFGSRFERRPGGWMVYPGPEDNPGDSLWLPVGLPGGTPFTATPASSGAGINRGQVDFVRFGHTPGGQDSLTRYTFSRPYGYHFKIRQIELSKKLGIVRAICNVNTATDTLELVTMPEALIGRPLPRRIDFYPYQPGDSIAYVDSTEMTLTPGHPMLVTARQYTRMGILSRSVSNDTLTVRAGRTILTNTYANCPGCVNSSTFRSDTITMIEYVGPNRNPLDLCTDDVWEPAPGVLVPYPGLKGLGPAGFLLKTSLFGSRIQQPACDWMAFQIPLDGYHEDWAAEGLGAYRRFSAFMGTNRTSGGLQGYCPGGQACGFAPLSGLVGLKEKLSFQTLPASPNPARGQVSVALPAGARPADAFQVVDALGRPVAVRFSQEGALVRVDIKDLPKGLYQVRIAAGGAGYSGRFAKE